MSLRLDTATFAQLADEELARWRGDPAWADLAEGVSLAVEESSDPAPMATYGSQTITLRKKPIQALVDTEGAAREVVRNLIRWGLAQRMLA